MDTRPYLRLSTALSGAGVLFSGYLSSVRLLSNQCAFSEPCPMFLGQPACYTGLALFLALLLPSAVALAQGGRARWPAELNLLISAVGLLFAGWITLGELTSGAARGYALGLPSCAYGAVFFLAELLLSALAARRPGLPPAQA